MRTRAILPMCFLAFALATSLNAQKLELTPYGFVKGEATYVSSGVLSFSKADIAAPQLATGVDTSSLGYTAQHTRLGLKGSVGDDIKVGGLIEMDFFTNAMESNVRPRMRLGYAWMSTGNFEIRLGQQWDLFSPNNPATNQTNANMWFGGNLGFRRGQIQLAYAMPMEDFTPKLQLALCEGAADPMIWDNWSGIPMLQGRLSATFMKKFVVGAYFANTTFSPIPDSSDLNYSTSGFGVDFTLPLDEKFTLWGEFSTGTNLLNSNLFSIAGMGNKEVERKSTAFWINAQSKLSDMLHIVAGLGMDQNNTDEKFLGSGDVISNMVVYGNLTFPFPGGFALIFEVMNITTEYKDGIVRYSGGRSAGEEKRSALVLNLSGRVTF
jgi:hypothetical protein